MNLPNGYLLQNGKYKLTQVVGQGGFGITYKGVWFTEVRGALGTIHTEVPVCIKEFYFKDYCDRDPQTYAVTVHSETGIQFFDKFREKLIKEAKILSDVHHPYIVNVLEVFEENHTAYIVMEYIAGQSLKSKLEKEGVLPEPCVLKYVRQIGEALQFVHEKHILHLDIKPSNILVDEHDDARLIDFGVSKRYDMEQQETSTTMLSLSKGFASIEQYDDEGTQNFSPCPDIYSLGATMYNLLTGKIPTESILRVTRPLIPPRELNPSISPKTEAAILRAMELVPANRFQSVAEMMASLDLPEIPAEKPRQTPEERDDASLRERATASAGDDDEEDTMLQHSDEETIVSSPGKSSFPGEKDMLSSSAPSKSEKRSYWKIGAAVMVVFLILGWGVWAVLTQRTSGKERVVAEMEAEEDRILPEETPSDSIPKPEELESQTSSPSAAVKTPQPDVEKAPERVETVVPDKPVETPKEDVPAKPEAEESVEGVDIEQKYRSFVASGRGRMQAGDYAGAKADFTAARNLMLTEEVVRLMIDCDAKAEEQRTADRIAQYEEKMSFGAYRIVRKKSDGFYGAIDSEGYEKIPCRYLSVGIAEHGRAFERTDNLFDIYNSKGELITEGATYY